MKSIRTLSILFFLLISIITQAQSTVIATSTLNLRESPCVNGHIIGTVVKGSTISTCRNLANGWIEVIYDGTTGYIKSKYTSYNHTCRNKLHISKSNKKHSHRSNIHGIKHYTNSYGNRVQSPTYYNRVPQGATARCVDGTYSFSQSRRGTCSRHGGVSVWL